MLNNILRDRNKYATKHVERSRHRSKEQKNKSNKLNFHSIANS